MRVLVVTNMLPTARRPWFGMFVRDQVEDLRRLGIDISVLFVNGVERKSNYARAAVRLRQLLSTRQLDLVHAHYGLTGAVAVTQRRVPVVTTFHGSDSSGNIPWQKSVSWLVARLSTPVFVSERLATGLGCGGAAVIPAAVDLDVFRPGDRLAARRALDWAPEGNVALLPGSRGDPAKRAELFDAALEHARRHVPDLRGASLEGLTREQVAQTMKAADVTVVTSRAEGSPVAVRESLACLTPVVAVAVGDLPELLADLPGCAVVPPDPARLGDALVAALAERGRPELRERIAPYGRRVIAERIVDVYRAVLAGRER
jgi:glycosyltransferase involved in cell wall biosynthesis